MVVSVSRVGPDWYTILHIILFDKYSQSRCNVTDTILSSDETSVNKTKFLPL